MKMITEINKLEDKTTNMFPVLMIHQDDLDRPDPLIVMFYETDCGVSVSMNNNCPEQWRHRFWCMEDFVPFRGSITLRNE